MLRRPGDFSTKWPPKMSGDLVAMDTHLKKNLIQSKSVCETGFIYAEMNRLRKVTDQPKGTVVSTCVDIFQWCP